MDSVIELQRQTHEELERFQSALVSLLVEKPPAHKESLILQHSASKLLDRIEGRAQALTGHYLDEGTRQTEIEYLSAPQKPDDLSQFYSRLVKIRDHHRKYPDSVADGFEIELRGILEPRISIGADNELEEEDRKYLQFDTVTSISPFIFSYFPTFLRRRRIRSILGPTRPTYCI